MTKEQCIVKLEKLLNQTDPEDETQAIQYFAAASSLIDWVARGDEMAREQFRVYLSYFEIFAFRLSQDVADEIARETCRSELAKLPFHLPRQ